MMPKAVSNAEKQAKMIRNYKSRAKLVVCAAAGLNFLTGILYIWSVLSEALIDEMHWTCKEACMPYTVATISFVIFMIVFGRLQDTKGPRFTATFSAVFMGMGLILSGLALNPVLMVVTFGIITGAGIGIGSISTMPAAVKWFPPRKKGLITGIVVAGIGMSSVFFAPLASALLKAVGIAKTFIYCGIGILIVGLLFASQLRNPPLYMVVNNKQNRSKTTPDSTFGKKEITPTEMLKTDSFYRLWLMLAFSTAAGLMIIGHTANIARIQANWEAGFLLVVLLAIFNTLGRFLGGAISDKIGQFNLMRIIFTLQAVNMFCFSLYDSITSLAFGVAVAGACYGAIYSVYPATSVELFGIKNVGANYGLLFTGFGAGGLIGPMTAAAIFDATGSYDNAYLIACILLIIALMTTFTFRPLQRRTNMALGEVV